MFGLVIFICFIFILITVKVQVPVDQYFANEGGEILLVILYYGCIKADQALILAGKPGNIFVRIRINEVYPDRWDPEEGYSFEKKGPIRLNNGLVIP